MHNFHLIIIIITVVIILGGGGGGIPSLSPHLQLIIIRYYLLMVFIERLVNYS